jgi:hypothetical protein
MNKKGPPARIGQVHLPEYRMVNYFNSILIKAVGEAAAMFESDVIRKATHSLTK